MYFLSHLAERLPVPHIVQIVEPTTSMDGAILMECLPGWPLKIADLTDALACEAGSLLARIHLNRTTGYGDLSDADHLSPDARVYFTLKFEEGFRECSHHLSAELMKQCRRYFDEHLHLLSSVDGPCMIHRDFRPGNLIVDHGKIQGIIDWASGRASFAQEDFCSMEHGEWTTNLTSRKSFLEGYARIRSIPDYSVMMPLLRLSRALNIIGFTVKTKTWETSNARMYQFNRRFLEELL